MAFFSSDDLIDAIRYEFGIEDETGLCRKVVPRPSRRPKPGGLPLDFRNDGASVSDDEEYSPNYFARPEEISTKNVVETRLRSKTSESERSSAVDSTKCVNVLVAGAAQSDEKKEEPDFLQFCEVPSSVEFRRSLTTKLVRENTKVIDPNLAAFAEYESTDPSQCRKLLVFFPFAEALPGEPYGCALHINVYPRTSVLNLIGLCCFVYMRNYRKPEISDPTRFQMLMAEDNGEVDRDLPAIDGHRLLSELGSCWSTVAIVPRSSTEDNSSEKTRIVVYTIGGLEFEFLLDSVDVSLRWLRDQALERRKEIEGDGFLSEYPAMQDYVLEAVRKPNVLLNLDATVESTSYTEFLLLRKNSTRGDFHLPVGADCEPNSPLLTPIASSSDRHSPRFVVDTLEYACGTFGESGSTFSLPIDKFNVGVVLEEFSVERLHRYKPKAAAKLFLCKDGFELKPDLSDRRRSVIFPVAFEKPLSVLWNCVGVVEVVEHSKAKRHLKIVWIPPPESTFCSLKSDLPTLSASSVSSRTSSIDSFENDEANKLYFSLINEKSRWKKLLLEMAADDACIFAAKANEILDCCQPQTRSLYKMSGGGKRKPSVAYEAAVNLSARKSSALKLAPKMSTDKRSSTPKVRGNRISRLAISIQRIWNREQ